MNNFLDVDKTVTFNSPLKEDEIFVRKGTISDGSCLFHCILKSLSNTYSSLDNKKKHEYVKKIRKKLSKKINYNIWESISYGIVSKVMFQENINILLTLFYNYVNKEKINNSINIVVENVIKITMI